VKKAFGINERKTTANTLSFISYQIYQLKKTTAANSVQKTAITLNHNGHCCRRDSLLTNNAGGTTN
jgi:hypothetical protein